MGILDSLLRLGVDVVRLPISVIKDGINVGTGEETGDTVENLKDILEDIVGKEE